MKVLCALLASVIVGVPLSGATIVSNLPNANTSHAFAILPGESVVLGFTMGVNSYDLTSVQASLNMVPGNPNPTLAAIFEDDGSNQPGAQLLALNVPVNAGSQVYTFTPVSALTLAANTTYWLAIGLGGTGGSGMNWNGAFPAVVPTGPGATFIATDFFSSGFPAGGSPRNDGLPGVAINGDLSLSSVPEPGSASLLGLGLILAWRFRARRCLPV